MKEPEITEEIREILKGVSLEDKSEKVVQEEEKKPILRVNRGESKGAGPFFVYTSNVE